MADSTHFVYMFLPAAETREVTQDIATFMTNPNGHEFSIDEDEEPLKFKFYQLPYHDASLAHMNNLTFFFKTPYSDQCVAAAIARFTRRLITHLRATHPGLTCSSMTNRILQQGIVGH